MKQDRRLPGLLDWSPLPSAGLLLFLHGVGERGHDGLAPRSYGFFQDSRSFLGAGAPNDLGMSLWTPQCPADDYWIAISQWGDPHYRVSARPTLAMAALIEDINQLLADPKVDDRRILGIGLSMGAYGILDLAVRRPGVLSGVLVISGAGDPSRAEDYRDLPMLMVHGQNDPLIPVARVEAFAAAVRAAGGDVTLITYRDVGHDAWTRGLADPQVHAWLTAHSCH